MSITQREKVKQLCGILGELTKWEQRCVSDISNWLAKGCGLSKGQTWKINQIHAQCCERRWI